MEMLHAQHLRQQYQEVQPLLSALLTAYPQFLTPDMFNWSAYLWAVELWYAYAMQVGAHPAIHV